MGNLSSLSKVATKSLPRNYAKDNEHRNFSCSDEKQTFILVWALQQ
jgi:hypothetical protein